MSNLLKYMYILLLCIFFLCEAVEAQSKTTPVFTKNIQKNSVYWHDGNRKHRLWKSLNEITIHADNKHSLKEKIATAKSLIPTIRVIEANDAWAIIQLAQQTYDNKSIDTLYRPRLQNEDGIKVTAVYYNSKYTESTPYLSTGEMIVHFDKYHTQEQAKKWGTHHNLKLLKYLNLENIFLYHCGLSSNCLKRSNEAYQEAGIQYAYPNWLRPKYSNHRGSFKTNDSLFSEQWYLNNPKQPSKLLGEDINITTAWNDGHGTHNEIIAIVDDGLDIQHEDLIDNIITDLNWNFVEDNSDPAHVNDHDHGTRVAGVTAARGGNHKGISGVAPHAGLVGLRLLGAATFDKFAAALTHRYEKIDIYNCSWGPPDNGHLAGLSLIEELALKDGIDHGRGGKGSIYIFTAGNGRKTGDHSNYNGYANSPYTLAVGASTDQGTQAPYSESGANLWVNAPSHSDIPNIITTVASGPLSSKQYGSKFGGTSAAVPQVSGVVALMLEQNSQLGWRDVQHILAKTAYRNDDNDVDWIKNGAGYWVNHKYGFGRVDAAAATTAAANWTLLPPQITVEHSVQPNLLIPDNDESGIHSTITVEENLSIDYVEIKFHSQHPFWGDLEIILVSPEGTESILAENGYRGGDEYQHAWRFGIARLLGESSRGKWELKIKDMSAVDIGYLQDWTIKIYGTQLDLSRILPQEGLWSNPKRPGHGLDIQVVGDTLFVVWRTFNEEGHSIWYTGSGPITSNIWSADLNVYHWKENKAIPNKAGNISLKMINSTHANFSWVLGDHSGSGPIEYFVMPDDSSSTPNYTGTWFEPKRPGYGVSVSTHGDTQAAILYIYDQSGIPRWVSGVSYRDEDKSIDISNYQGYCAYCPKTPIVGHKIGDIQLLFDSIFSGFLTINLDLNPIFSKEWDAVRVPIKNLSQI